MEERKKKDTGDTVHLSCEQCHFCTTAETSCREVGLNEHFFIGFIHVIPTLSCKQCLTDFIPTNILCPSLALIFVHVRADERASK